MTMSDWTVPVIDPSTGDGWDIDVEAETPQEAIEEATETADKEVHIASTFINEHIEIEM